MLRRRDRHGAGAAASSTDAALDALFQQREVQVQRFDAKDYRGQGRVRPTPKSRRTTRIRPTRRSSRRPRQASIEYVVLDLEALKKGITVPEDDLRKYYAENEARYTAPEERRAQPHPDQGRQGRRAEAERDKAKAKAESLLAELKKNPAAFAELAKKNSEDPGSAANGGDLDFFGRGAMVKPFEDAAFALKPGEMSGVVESDFGYPHHPASTAVRGGENEDFEAVRAADRERSARTSSRRSGSPKRPSEFTNMVYEQSDSLQAGGRQVEARRCRRRSTCCARRRRARAARSPMPSSSTRCSRRRRCTTSATPKRSRSVPNQLASGRVVKHTPQRTAAAGRA